MAKVEWDVVRASGVGAHLHRVFNCSGTIIIADMVVPRDTKVEAECERNGKAVGLESVGNGFICPMFETRKCILKKS